MNDEKRADLLEAVTEIMVDTFDLYGAAPDLIGMYGAGQKIIELVEADVQRRLAGERKRIRDKLLDPVMFNEEFIGQLAVILDFIGLTEGVTHGLE